jgi:hypothetical protein
MERNVCKAIQIDNCIDKEMREFRSFGRAIYNMVYNNESMTTKEIDQHIKDNFSMYFRMTMSDLYNTESYHRCSIKEAILLGIYKEHLEHGADDKDTLKKAKLISEIYLSSLDGSLYN